VRAIVSETLGRSYFGCDLRERQVLENIKQSEAIGLAPRFICADALEIEPPAHTLLFTCPPYGTLEKYGDDSRCLANMEFPRFIESLIAILAKWSLKLSDGGFMVIVANNFREKQGGVYTALRPMCGELAVRLPDAAGIEFWDECAFLTALGTVPVRASHNWRTGRKLGRCWQRVLVFRKPTSTTRSTGEE